MPAAESAADARPPQPSDEDTSTDTRSRRVSQPYGKGWIGFRKREAQSVPEAATCPVTVTTAPRGLGARPPGETRSAPGQRIPLTGGTQNVAPKGFEPSLPP